MALAPIILFAYKRLDILKTTIQKLQENSLATESVLYIYSDAARNADDEQIINEVREYLKTISGFKSVTIVESEQNKGLARSIISGVNDVLKIYEKVIVLEDDILTTPNFLKFMNDALDFYEGEKKIFSVCGYTDNLAISPKYPYDIYFTQRGSSWGWGTWRDRWSPIDWSVKDYAAFSKSWSMKVRFNKMGSDMSAMLRKKMEGRIDSWAIRWCFHQFKHNLYSVYPTVSKVHNIGFDKNATNMYGYKLIPATTPANYKLEFKFTDNVVMDKQIIAEFTKQYSILTRTKNKLRYYLNTRIFKLK